MYMISCYILVFISLICIHVCRQLSTCPSILMCASGSLLVYTRHNQPFFDGSSDFLLLLLASPGVGFPFFFNKLMGVFSKVNHNHHQSLNPPEISPFSTCPSGHSCPKKLNRCWSACWAAAVAWRLRLGHGVTGHSGDHQRFHGPLADMPRLRS